MTDFLDKLKEAEALAREWLEFSEATYGWNCRDYADNVRCYFADACNHTAVTFGRYGEQVQISFFSPVQFGGMSLRAVARLDDTIRQARDLLAEERVSAATRSEAEVLAERSARIERLKEQLAELEGGVAA